MTLGRATTRALGVSGALALVGATWACVQTTTHHPVGAGGAATLHPVPASAEWDVIERGRTIGAVVRFAETSGADLREGDFLYVVRNEHGQDLGLVDAQGCAWRRRPHAPNEQLGAGTLEASVQRVLGAGPSARLVPREIGGGASPQAP